MKSNLMRWVAGRAAGLRAVAAAGTLLLALSGCADLRPLSIQAEGPRQGLWLELEDSHRVEVSPGITLELPLAPYHARFEDARGVYFQAFAPLLYRTQHGVVTPVAGGLYVPYDRPGEGTAWIQPQLGAHPAPNPRPVRVRLMRAS